MLKSSQTNKYLPTCHKQQQQRQQQQTIVIKFGTLFHCTEWMTIEPPPAADKKPQALSCVSRVSGPIIN
jgi:hypothetical protein